MTSYETGFSRITMMMSSRNLSSPLSLSLSREFCQSGCAKNKQEVVSFRLLSFEDLSAFLKKTGHLRFKFFDPLPTSLDFGDFFQKSKVRLFSGKVNKSARARERKTTASQHE
jgi:hypothetical protein